MTKKIGNDHAMSYVRKISLVAGSISALALMSTTKASQAAGVTAAPAVSSGEITVDWDLDALDTNDEMLLASDTESDTGSDTESDTDELCTVTESNSDTCIPLSDTGSDSDSDSGSDSDSDSDSGSDSDSDSDSGSDSDSDSGSDSEEDSAALPGAQLVATETFTFDVANASSDLVALSVASNW